MWLDYKTASGQQGSARLVIDTARAGILLDARPIGAAQLAGLFDCCIRADPMREFRIGGDGADDLQRMFSISWLQVAIDPVR